MTKTIKYILSCLLLSLTTIIPVNATGDTNDFYFSSADFDYTLEKDSENVSILKVKETLTAEFPDFDQNHGIVRSIPYKNRGGENITLKNLTDGANLTVKRNGEDEQVAKIEKTDEVFNVYIGSNFEYVHGTQVYTLEYEFRNVITEFDDYQELYWDTNGTGWSQDFNNLSVTIHSGDQSIKNSMKFDSCYVGLLGEKGEGRCTFSEDEEGTIHLESSDLKAGENLTFVLLFKPETFVVLHNYNYILVALSIGGTIIALGIIIAVYMRWRKKGKENYLYKKRLFTVAQYQPPKNLTVAESGCLLGIKKKTYVATLLELAVSKKIVIKQGEPTKILKKNTWIILVKDISNLTIAQSNVLRILKGGKDLKDNSEIIVEERNATSTMKSLAEDYEESSKDNLLKKGLLVEKHKKKSFTNTFLITIVLFVIFVNLFPSILYYLVFSLDFEGEVVGAEILIPYLVILTFVTIIVAFNFTIKTNRYAPYSEEGLDTCNYLEGLELYIKMAEKDRLEFLQSVDGAPRNQEDIVHLYEKLLPYACLFGLENSWLKELNKYYALDTIENPTWYSGNDALFTISTFNSISSDISRNISHSTTYSYSASSGSSFSSSSSGSSSGGGGGGFSGGGGGGGGGGGW